MFQRISVIGMGYIGLPTATLLAKSGFKVFGFDVNPKVIDTLSNGNIHIVEPDLQEAFSIALKSGNLTPAKKIEPAEIFVICVPTPFLCQEECKKADLSYVYNASCEVGKVLKNGDLVILESTVPPGTTNEIMGKALEECSGLKMNSDFYLAHCPERVLPGKIMFELKNNHRVIGVNDKKTGEIVKKVYSTFLTEDKIHITDVLTAEMCKLVENTYRDINIAYANELSIICKDIGINVNKLISLSNLHPRVEILKPGAGVGGHCISVDPWFLVEKFPTTSKLIHTARRVNDYKPEWIVEQVKEKVSIMGLGKDCKICIFGLAFKPNIDDIRESPSMHIAKKLSDERYKVIGCEPNVDKDEIQGIANIPIEAAISKSDFIVYTLSHNVFLEEETQRKIKTKPYYDCVGDLE